MINDACCDCAVDVVLSVFFVSPPSSLICSLFLLPCINLIGPLGDMNFVFVARKASGGCVEFYATWYEALRTNEGQLFTQHVDPSCRN